MRVTDSGIGARTGRGGSLVGHAALLWLVLTASPVYAQTFQGRVVEAGTDAPVVTALVSLIDSEGDQVGVSIADSAGFYRVSAGEPGVYRLRAERIGYLAFETPRLEAGVEDGTYPVDLVLEADPFELPGFTVETNRVSDEDADREVRLMIGLSVASLRLRPIGYRTIQSHVDRAHTLADLLRWEQTGPLFVSYDQEGPCFSVRARGCLPVYFNGLRLRREFVETIPLDMVYRIVVLTPTDGSLTYGAGGVMLFTEAWLR